MPRSKASDLLNVLKGVQRVTNTFIKHQEDTIRYRITHSSLKDIPEKCLRAVGKTLTNTEPRKVPEQIIKDLKEITERISVVEKGIKQYIKVTTNRTFNIESNDYTLKKETKLYVYNTAKDPKELPIDGNVILPKHNIDKSITQKSLKDMQNDTTKKYMSVKEKIKTISNLDKDEIPDLEFSDKDKEILRKLELEHEKKIKNRIVGSAYSTVKTYEKENVHMEMNSKEKPKLSVRPKQCLSPTAKEKKVPSTRLQRMVSFGTLGIGLGLGTAAEYTRRTLGLKGHSIGDTVDNMFLTKANAERIVSTLCKVRGAALKIGQILSIQDNTIISPELQKIFERVRQSADFMPTWQVEKVLTNELGHNWRNKLAFFEEKPFAAASIGQVHHGTLLNKQDVAIKIQYPGVAMGIQSDIENLVGIMKVWNMFPEGMFIDNVVEVAKRELAWEVDYTREAECTKKYKKLIMPYPEYYVPTVIDDLSTKQVFTTEMIEGIPVDKCIDMDITIKEYISELLMRLSLKELFEFRYMQTDPNWSNFFYNLDTKQLILLDFGACRTYDKIFMDKYIEIINAASEGNRNKVLQLSQEMKFLTGYESKIMEDAHVDAVMILGQVFDNNHEYYDFGGQDVTKRIQVLVPTIINHRLCPPPEEIYSLHRKLSGIFLLCAKLGTKIKCRDIFREIYANYKFG
ncbi:PREDICTED: aarF domain-containing protein kinase 4 [Acromyrmex echinatior]|uniref:Chaperone activity of bc1 complex-like, mitochondrial n=1 Tax=Acromyrmex echinatior TaxID=103372 RepID=F4WUA7_ACREC|nr:PREDICTED: aarF domain-containing protein kinase 4 [Acromyrmex echinatior]XP_011059901.1 PREDICTED: aarF domain-containing protein kinase 4 [Acromyrmex echinatior]EGI62215.1 Chaperone activity of bc1 complex-like, mitochondrial [Acromyrmex echinatior]